MTSRIPRIMFAAPASGSGKTMLTCGFLKLCTNRQLNVRAMKCGPDYIDPMFHQYILGHTGTNLDSFFLEEGQVKDLFIQATEGCDMAVMEGVMGYYDGVAGISTEASTYDIARITRTPVVLIVDGRKGSLSLAALIKGFQDFREDSGICGVILNRTTQVLAERLRPEIEALGLYLAGWIPECRDADLKSRHLGLILPAEQEALLDKVEHLAEQMQAGLDMDWLLKTANAAPVMSSEEKVEEYRTKTQLRGQHGGRYQVAVARDEAFSFYYQENLRILKDAGARVTYFSPLNDTEVPAQTDAILLGGGYPELYAEILSKNDLMLDSLRRFAEAGGKILAECGGFLYLHQSLEGADGKSYSMVGLIAGHGYRTERLSRFGYLTLQGQGETMKGHEFHYWDSDNCGSSYMAVKPLSTRSWPCMHQTNTMLAGFPHLYYPSNPDLIYRFLNSQEANQS